MTDTHEIYEAEEPLLIGNGMKVINASEALKSDVFHSADYDPMTRKFSEDRPQISAERENELKKSMKERCGSLSTQKEN